MAVVTGLSGPVLGGAYGSGKARFPDASLHLIDLSAAMLDKARERFEGETRTTFEVANYPVAALQGRYNAVVSALSIHHLRMMRSARSSIRS
jgi:hypothetical protein